MNYSLEILNLAKNNNGVITTALFLCDPTDRTLGKYHMTFPSTYNLSRPKGDGILCSGSKELIYSVGVQEIHTPGGNTVRAYLELLL